jgi:hypothetical protein
MALKRHGTWPALVALLDEFVRGFGAGRGCSGVLLAWSKGCGQESSRRFESNCTAGLHAFVAEFVIMNAKRSS